jgi:ribosomal protein S18 acetylase RimI-like enzyme
VTGRVRLTSAEDRPGLAQLLDGIPGFNEEDAAIALELLDIYLTQPGQKDYAFFSALGEDGRVNGFLCWGPTPLTLGTYDLYWVAVATDCFGQGVGKLLLDQFETAVRKQAGRLIVIETSSAPSYSQARRFYLKHGYELAETLRDFYQPGEDRLTYTKYL